MYDSTLISRLIQIGVSLSSIHDLDMLLELIVKEARKFTNSDAGSLYIREGDQLKFVVSQNDSLKERSGEYYLKESFIGTSLPLEKTSLAGYVAITGEPLNLDDAYHIPESLNIKFNRAFDEKNSYRSKSLLMIPMKNINDDVIGVLQLINAQDDNGNVIPFHEDYVNLVASLASQAAVAISNAQLTEGIKKAHIDTIWRLSLAAEYKDEDTASHLMRISFYSRLLAEKLNQPSEWVELLFYASPMHDIGKIGVPDSILLKPGKLTDEERLEMMKHASIGAKILEGSDNPLIQLSHEVAMTHHEKWDGTGYPKNLKGENIPISGRIVALVDVFDALSNKRCYKPAFPMNVVSGIIKDERGNHFDPQLVDVFFDYFDEIQDIHSKYKD